MGKKRDILEKDYSFQVWRAKLGWVPKKVPRYRMSELWAIISSFWDVSNVKGMVFDKGWNLK